MLLTKRSGKYVINKPRTENRMIGAIVLIGIITTTLFFVTNLGSTGFESTRLIKMLTGIFRIDLVDWFTWKNIFRGMAVSISLAAIVTILSTLFGVVFGAFASRNLVHKNIVTFVKGMFAFVRAVPTVIIVIAFIPSFGITATAAVIGMLFHSIAFFVKAFSETFEEVDEATIEALRATGSNKIKIFVSAILPSSYTKLIGWLALRFEINIAVAIIIGPVVGVPGSIGTIINSFVRYSVWHGVGAALLVVIIVAYVIEILVEKLKK